jgi:hypothetical protein
MQNPLTSQTNWSSSHLLRAALKQNQEMHIKDNIRNAELDRGSLMLIAKSKLDLL